MRQDEDDTKDEGVERDGTGKTDAELSDDLLARETNALTQIMMLPLR